MLSTFSYLRARFPRLTAVMIGALVTLCAMTMRALAANEQVQVRTVSGADYAGEIDAATNADFLWLRRGDASIAVRRKIAWQDIERAALAGRAVELDALRDAAKAPAADSPPIKFHGVFSHPPASQALATPKRPPLRAIEAYATLGQWDNDVEYDGLVVTVLPIDRSGAPLNVPGTLEVDLLAPQIRDFNEAPRSRGATLERIGRWTKNIGPHDFTSRGIVVELPFQAVHPQFDTEIGYWGVVNVRFVVPGDGTFDATLDYVRIKPYSPLRQYYGQPLRQRGN